jgi:branched-chain amino acid transport system substrate-binding protein
MSTLRRGPARLLAAPVGLAVLAVMAGCGSSGTSGSSSGSGPILIGASTVLSGPNAYAGEDWLHGLQLGIKKVNASGGVFGRKLQIVTADNACDPATAVSATRKLIDDHVAIILGSVCSGATLAAMPLVKSAEIVQLTDDSSAPQITQEAGVGGNPWEFRVNVDSSMLAGALADYVAKKAHSVYFIAENDSFGVDGVQGYTKPLADQGVKTLGTQYYTPGLGDFSPILSKVQAAHPQAIVLISEPHDAATIVRQMHGLNMTQPVFDGGGALSQEFMTAIGQVSLANGIVGATFWNPAEDPSFTKAFKAAYGTTPPPDAVGPYYDASVLAKAIELGGSATPAAIRKGLHKVDISEPWGRIQFDSHDQAHPNVALQIADNGQIKLLKVAASSGE